MKHTKLFEDFVRDTEYYDIQEKQKARENSIDNLLDTKKAPHSKILTEIRKTFPKFFNI